MNCFKNQRAGREGESLCAALLVHRQLLQRGCHITACAIDAKFTSPAPPGCHPSGRNPCPEYCRSNCVCAAGGTQLVATAGGGFVPEHWVTIGPVTVGPNYEHLTRLQLSGHSWKQESGHFWCSCGIVPAPSLLLVCSQLLMGRTGFTVGLKKNSSCSGEQKVTSALKWSTPCWVNVKGFPETSASYWSMNNEIPLVLKYPEGKRNQSLPCLFRLFKAEPTWNHSKLIDTEWMTRACYKQAVFRFYLCSY